MTIAVAIDALSLSHLGAATKKDLVKNYFRQEEFLHVISYLAETIGGRPPKRHKL